MSNANLEMATWALHAKDQETRVDELEDALEEIKSIIASGLCSDRKKLRHILKVVEEMN